MSFGDEIKRIRTKELKITLDQLSKASGLSKGFLSKLENNKQDISRVDNIKKLATGLNVPYINLMKLAGYGGKDNPIPSDSFFDLLHDTSTKNPFDSMSSEEIEEYINSQSRHSSIEEYKELEFPDIKHFLNKNEVYYDKKRLNKDNIIIIKELLDALTKDLEVNYPSSARIEAEHDNFIKSIEVTYKRNERIERKNNKDGD